MAHLDQSLCRSDDPFCGGLRRVVPDSTFGASSIFLLAGSISRQYRRVASVPQPIGMGFLRHFNLWACIIPILVCRSAARSSDLTRSRQAPMGQNDLWCASDGLARIGSPLAAPPEGLFSTGCISHTAGGFSTQHRESGFCRWDHPRLAFDDLPALFRRRGDLFWLCDGDNTGYSEI